MEADNTKPPIADRTRITAHLLNKGRCHIFAIYISQKRLDLFQAEVAHMLQQNRMQVPLYNQPWVRGTTFRLMQQGK